MKNVIVFLLINFFILSQDQSQAQWVQTNGPCSGSVTSFAVSGTNLFAGIWGGVFLSTNNGTSWTAVNNGLAHLYLYI